MPSISEKLYKWYDTIEAIFCKCYDTIEAKFSKYEDRIKRIFSAIYDSIKIVASAVVGATFALAIRDDFILNKGVVALSILAVILALSCSYESQRLEEAESVSRDFFGSVIVVGVLAVVIACLANSLSIDPS